MSKGLLYNIHLEGLISAYKHQIARIEKETSDSSGKELVIMTIRSHIEDLEALIKMVEEY